ncbi:hypothetical protein TEA_002281 [Camellia sinensis var. sinensis]|uniref:BACK domain-containing protein n=1 Tax=Camellia sinensis var. sinensis TaxID=542762 RepID=A0A4S4EUP0_CAMSN|nr:hypothetical protein TEA_002281 [Camellia sinensis var. sinensis]
MRDTSLDLFDPRTVMDSDYSPNGGRDGDFGFAFNDSNFSDRVLRIEIMADSPETGSDGEGCHGLADWARYRKRRREDVKKDNAVDTVGCPEEQILSCNQPDTDDCVGCENQDEEAVAMIEESPSGDDEAGNSNDSNWSMDCSTVLRVKTLHISSPILAAKSPFFYKLFSNGMRESEQRHVALRINASVICENGIDVQPLTDAAKQFHDEVMSLPLAGIEAVLSSDDLQVASEDAVYDFVLKWSRAQYPKLEERREILGSRLGRYIRYPYMTPRKLKKVLTCNDFDHDLASKVVLEALFFKAEAPHRQRTLAAEESATINRRFIERAYKYRPVKVIEFELPRQQCVVYLDLKREECANLFPSGRVYSQAFHLGGQGFFLSAHCNMDQQSSFHCFGLFLGMQEKGSVTFAVDYEFAARSKPTEEYISKYKGNYTFTGGKAVGYRNLFAIQWTSFMAEDSLYFLKGILHLRAELTIRH